MTPTEQNPKEPPNYGHHIAIWTDFRGVLTPPLTSTLQHYCNDKQFTLGQLRSALVSVAAAFGAPDAMAVLDSGLLNEQDWLSAISSELRIQFQISDDLGDFRQQWWSDRRTNAEWIAELRALRTAGAFVGVVSNLPIEWRSEFFGHIDGADFDHIALSCDLGFRKPDREMFDHLSVISGVPREGSILVDDLNGNVTGARDAGWNSFLFTGDSLTAGQFCRQLLNTSTPNVRVEAREERGTP
ncbi:MULTISPECIES: hypothetical protein [Nocardiaceae]|uniref:hypothetical protein n=1 Tax=Nocardiaceae TaxID=85025 RepID=UPI00068DBD57|nr:MULTISPECIES: hypothetical protein [Rhodococcus]